MNSLTSLLFDLHANVVVERKDEEVGDDIEDSNTHEYVGIIKWYSLRYLHHPEDDHQVGAVLVSQCTIARHSGERTLAD